MPQPSAEPACAVDLEQLLLKMMKLCPPGMPARRDMIGATLYLVGHEVDSGDYVENAAPCSMCKRLIINAGIKDVIVRDDKENFHTFLVDDWISNDESLDGTLGY